MNPLLFKDAFWGADFVDHSGYDILIQRLSEGRRMCKDVEDLLKMRALAEERYGKDLVTIARKAGRQTEISTLQTSFDHLKTQIENIGHLHVQLSGILRGEVKKIEIFREQQREQRKKLEEFMEKVQKMKVSFYKKTIESKRTYRQKCREADEAEQAAARVSHSASTPRQSEKMQNKAKQSRQAAIEAEKIYISNIESLEEVRQDWESTHKSTCEVFQQQEEDRIVVLRCAMWDHCNHFSIQCVKDDEIYEVVRKTLEKCDITTDHNSFIEMKSTFSSPPDPIVFEDFYQRESPISSSNVAEGRVSRRFSNLQENNADSMLSISDSSWSTVPSSAENLNAASIPVSNYQQQAASMSQTADEDIYVAQYDYTARDSDELSVDPGDVLVVLEQGEDGWWTVEKDGQTGLVPGCYLVMRSNTQSLEATCT